jgi:hypothetical protein
MNPAADYSDLEIVEPSEANQGYDDGRTDYRCGKAPKCRAPRDDYERAYLHGYNSAKQR